MHLLSVVRCFIPWRRLAVVVTSRAPARSIRRVVRESGEK